MLTGHPSGGRLASLLCSLSVCPDELDFLKAGGTGGDFYVLSIPLLVTKNNCYTSYTDLRIP
jgi:hypothetical protein